MGNDAIIILSVFSTFNFLCLGLFAVYALREVRNIARDFTDAFERVNSSDSELKASIFKALTTVTNETSKQNDSNS